MSSSKGNVAQSVRDRLLKLAKANGEDFNYVLTRYALERLLARIAASAYSDQFIVKGAMLFRAWSPKLYRPTKDLDLLGFGPPRVERLATVFGEIVQTNVDDDGISFDGGSVGASRIKEGADYEGIRVNITARIGSARLDLQVDVGFGDAITPAASEIDFPTLLPMSSPRVRAYTKETVVAEKVQAMVHLGIANSRMKDFFDVWFLANHFEFEGALLARALKATFDRRKTDLPAVPPLALTKAFAEDDAKMKQWRAFAAKTTLLSPTTPFSAIVDVAGAFALPAIEAARDNRAFDDTWSPGGPWASKRKNHPPAEP